MVKRVLMIGLLSIGLVAMLGTEAGAYSFNGGSFCWNCTPYDTTWLLSGGGGPSSYLRGDYNVSSAALVCLNPGTNKRDVRVGLGGFEFFTSTPENQFVPIDQAGHFAVTITFDSTDMTFFFGSQEYANSLCKPGWTAYELLILSVGITGQVFRCSDPNSCTLDDTYLMVCSTNTRPRDFSSTASILYNCQQQLL